MDMKKILLFVVVCFAMAFAAGARQGVVDGAEHMNDLAQDCYNQYAIHADNCRYDSAAYWLERRAALDTTNLQWQLDAGRFIADTLEDYTQALEYYWRGLREAVAQDGEQSEWVATCCSDIGAIYDRLGSYDQALKYYSKALDIREKVLGEDNPATAKSYYNVGFVYYDMEEYGKSLEYFSKAYDIFLKHYGPDHPDTQEAEEAINVLNDMLGQ